MSHCLRNKLKLLLPGAAAGLALHSQSLLACAACYGGSTDSPLAAGMNWGIFSLLMVVGCVLSGFAAFGVFLAKRSAALAAQPAESMDSAPSSTEKV